MSAEEKPSSFRKLVTSLWKKLDPELRLLTIIRSEMPRSVETACKRELGTAKIRVPRGLDPAIVKHDLYFTDPGTNSTFTGTPLKFLPGNYHQQVIEPGSRDPNGIRGIWVNEMQVTGRIDWSDDSRCGLFCRKMYSLKDALGSKGTLLGTPYVFEDILQIGQGLTVYQLTNQMTGSYVAVGIGRDEVDAVHALIKYLRKSGEGTISYSSSQAIALCDRVLEAFPEEETALFNKGVAKMIDHHFAESHACFERLIQQQPNDQFAILHDAAALAQMGEDNLALTQFIRADAISEEECETNLKLRSIRDPLKALMTKLTQLPVIAQDDVRHLWRRYFSTGESAS